MGSHSKEAHSGAGQRIEGLHVVRVTAWTVVGQTQISLVGLGLENQRQANIPLGSIKVPYPMLEMPAVGQVIYALGDELKRNWNQFGRV